jgi:hypothetical protein
MPIEPPEIPPATPGNPTEPPQEEPPGNPQPEIPVPVQEPDAPPQPATDAGIADLPGSAPDVIPGPLPSGTI